MPDLSYQPVRHNHQQFLAKARAREGFNKAHDALTLEYQLVDQLLRARTRAALTAHPRRHSRTQTAGCGRFLGCIPLR